MTDWAAFATGLARAGLDRLSWGVAPAAWVLSAWVLAGPSLAAGDEARADPAWGSTCGLQLLAGDREPLPGREAFEAWQSARPGGKPLGAAGQAQAEIAVGTQLPFAVAGSPFLVAATCQYVGEHVYIFVEDASWDLNGGSILQSHVDGLGTLFDRSCPADPERGVYELAVEAFGDPPDVDGYERLFLLILDIPDPRLVGFFDPAVAEHEVPELRRDVLYIDELAVRLYPYLARGTLAHEFQHLIHWGLDPDEDAWVNEGLSGYAEELVGYPEADPAAVPAFLESPGIALMEWEDADRNYGMTYLFMSFVAERYGVEVIHNLVADPLNGRYGLERALTTAGHTDSFEQVWGHWLVGNYVGDDPVYGYAATAGRRVATLSVEALPQPWAGAAVAGQWGSMTVVFRTPGDVMVQVDGDDDGRYLAWSVAMRAGVTEVRQVALDGANRGAVTALGIDSLALVVGRTSRAGREFEVAAGAAVPTAIAGGPVLPAATRLGDAFPNPFNSTVHVPLFLAHPGRARLVVHNALGQVVRVAQDGPLSAGRHDLTWDGRDQSGRPAASGTYLVLLEAEPGSAPATVARVTLTR